MRFGHSFAIGDTDARLEIDCSDDCRIFAAGSFLLSLGGCTANRTPALSLNHKEIIDDTDIV